MEPLQDLGRPVRLIATGGTIAMQGERAVPALDAAALVGQIRQLAIIPALATETALTLPGPHLSLDQALGVAQRAGAAAGQGEGVVITTGTDTMEELAVLCSMVYGGEAPIVLTGANRPASNPGADGPANLLDAVALAGAPVAAGLGVTVVFGGEIHAAMTVRKVDSTGPAAFGSPGTGPLGRVVEGRVWLHARPLGGRAGGPTFNITALERRVAIITAALGEGGHLLDQAAASCDGLVVVALGAGHLTPGMLGALRGAVEKVPVVVTCRPERAGMLFSTYGFEGAETDIRSSGAVCAPFLSAPAARIALLCCLAAGLDRAGIAAALTPWDAGSDREE